MKNNHKKVISRNNLPTKFPIQLTWISLLTMDYLNSPGWVYGIVVTVLVLIWISSIIIKLDEIEKDLWNEN